MRSSAPLALLLVLAACQSEPSFDERYDKAEESIRKKAVDIDAELAKREELRRQAEGDAGAAATASPGAPASQRKSAARAPVN